MNYPQSHWLFSDEIDFSPYIVFIVSIGIRAKKGLYLGSVLKAFVFQEISGCPAVLFCSQILRVVISTLMRMGVKGYSKNALLPVFSRVTSTYVRISPQNCLTFSSKLFATLV